MCPDLFVEIQYVTGLCVHNFASNYILPGNINRSVLGIERKVIAISVRKIVSLLVSLNFGVREVKVSNEFPVNSYTVMYIVSASDMVQNGSSPV